MKKHLLYFSLMIGVGAMTSSVHAQNMLNPDNSTVDFLLPQQVKKAKFYISPATAKALNQQKPTGTQYRLTSFAVRRFDGVFFNPTDTSSVFWTGKNKGETSLANYIEDNYYGLPIFAVTTPIDRYFDKNRTINFDSISSSQMDVGLGVFKPFSKNITQLDANGRVTESVSLSFNITNWEPTRKDLFTYNANGAVLSHIVQYYSSGVWDNNSRRLYDYDASGNLTQYTHTYWDNVASAWANSNRVNFNYSGQNHLTTEIGQTWNNVSSIWENDSKVEYFQDAAGNDTLQLETYWDDVTSQWTNGYKSNYTFNSNNQFTNIINRGWDGSNWVEDGKYIFTYNTSNLMENYYIQTWGGSNWIYNQQFKYSYTNNNLTEVSFASWNASSSSFQPVARLLRQFDANNLLIQSHAEQMDTSGWFVPVNTKKLNFYYGSFDDGTGGNDSTGTGINNQSFSNVQVYPNPAKDVINVKANNINYIKIVDIAGKVVFESKGKLNASEVSVPTSQLANGLYFIQLQSNNANGVKSFTVQH